MTYPETLGEVLTDAIQKAPPEKMLKRYKVLVCGRCKTGQAVDSEKTYMCRRCGTRQAIHPGSAYVLDFDLPQEAARRAADLESVCALVRATGDGSALARFFAKHRKSG